VEDVPAYIAVQLGGASVGVGAADAMFGEPLFALSQHTRYGFGQILSEFITTSGLVAVLFACVCRTPAAVPFAVASYITAAYCFTASTSFANPAVTLARSLIDTFAGVRPVDAPAFIAAQLVGGAAGAALTRWLIPPRSAAHLVVPHAASPVERKEAW
jgi:glycerol uptake facilitator-like aquaporin